MHSRVADLTKAIKTVQEPGTMIVIYILLLSMLDPEVRKGVLNAAGRDNDSTCADGRPDGPRRVFVDFEHTKSMVETVKRIDGQNRPAFMELGSFDEIHDHAAFVQWSDEGAADWT